MSLPSTERQLHVFDLESSRLLASGRECGADDDGHHLFDCTDGNGTLLVYYFGKGKREVIVGSGPNEGIHAHLATRWCGRQREWTLDW